VSDIFHILLKTVLAVFERKEV